MLREIFKYNKFSIFADTVILLLWVYDLITNFTWWTLVFLMAYIGVLIWSFVAEYRRLSKFHKKSSDGVRYPTGSPVDDIEEED